MKPRRHGFRSVMGPDIEQFVAHKRALGRRYDVEEKTLALFDDYLVAHHIADVSEVSVDLIDRFLASRPRPRPRSYNHLRCTLVRLFAWMVGQGRLERTPVQSRPRRATYQRQPFIFDVANARRLLDLVQTLPDKGGTVQRGKTYHALLAVLYGLGLRVSEVCRLRVAGRGLRAAIAGDPRDQVLQEPPGALRPKARGAAEGVPTAQGEALGHLHARGTLVLAARRSRDQPLHGESDVSSSHAATVDRNPTRMFAAALARSSSFLRVGCAPALVSQRG